MSNVLDNACMDAARNLSIMADVQLRPIFEALLLQGNKEEIKEMRTLLISMGKVIKRFTQNKDMVAPSLRAVSINGIAYRTEQDSVGDEYQKNSPIIDHSSNYYAIINEARPL